MDRLFRIDFYPQDWIIDTARLTPEERGVYIQIVALIYSNRAPIENNSAWIAGVSGCSSRAVKSIISKLAEKGFIQFSGEKITQKRAENELKNKRNHFEVSSKGGRNRAENSAKTPRESSESSAKTSRTGDENLGKHHENEHESKQNKDLTSSGHMISVSSSSPSPSPSPIEIDKESKNKIIYPLEPEKPEKPFKPILQDHGEEKKLPKKSRAEKPIDVTAETWQDFLTLRKQKKAPVTESALNRIRTEAEIAGWAMETALQECCARGWQGFKADWVKNNQNNNIGDKNGLFQGRGTSKYTIDDAERDANEYFRKKFEAEDAECRENNANHGDDQAVLCDARHLRENGGATEYLDDRDGGGFIRIPAISYPNRFS